MTKFKVGDLINWTERKYNLPQFLAIVIKVDKCQIRVYVVNSLNHTYHPWEGCYYLTIPDADIKVIK